jgi:hypothetical protein
LGQRLLRWCPPPHEPESHGVIHIKKRGLDLGMQMMVQANLEERVVAERELLLGVDAEAVAVAEPEGGLHGRVGFSKYCNVTWERK